MTLHTEMQEAWIGLAPEHWLSVLPHPWDLLDDLSVLPDPWDLL